MKTETPEEKTVSRQVAWYRKTRQTTKCPGCGGVKSLEASGCITCLTTRAAKARERTGHKEWQPGSRGRPPLITKIEQKAPAAV